YYPVQSEISSNVHEISRRLKEDGMQLLLLSRSWCEIASDSEAFLYIMENKREPFERKHYVDPIQMRLSNADVIKLMIGLACKLMDYEDISRVLFLDSLEYLPVYQVIRMNYQVRGTLFLHSEEQVKAGFRGYSYPNMRNAIKSFDEYRTIPKYNALLEEMGIDSKKVKIADKSIELW
ncbi:MAG: hypothetical protein IJP92_16655, partial [Lachnospiraceae bacterium]|nr:hypothetical protein [Lachnospiraceae bacterium]